MGITEKVCTVCKTLKPLTEFRRYSGRSRGGTRPLCKVCQREYEKMWRSSSIEYRAAQRKKRRESDKLYRQKYNMANKARYLISSIKSRCQRRGIQFDLDQYEAEINKRIENGICEVSGFPLRLVYGKQDYNSPSIDRIDPKGGYVYHNIRIVAFAVNAAMGSWGEENFKQIMKTWMEK